MIKLSLWARHHRGQARALIIALHLLLNMLAIYTGIVLQQVGLQVHPLLIYTAVFLFVSAAMAYPSYSPENNRFTKQKGYTIRKTCDFVLAACSFILVCFAANNYAGAQTARLAFTAAAVSISKDGEKTKAEEILASLAYRDKRTLTRAEKRILKNEFGHQLKVYAKAKLAKDDEGTKKSLFIILSIIAAIGLTLLLATLACSVSCSGSDAGAVIIVLLGLAAIIWLLVIVINKINHHQKKSKEKPVENNVQLE